MFTGYACALLFRIVAHRDTHLNPEGPKGPSCKFTVQLMPARSHNSDLVGDFEGVVVLGQDHVGLLFTTRGDQGVDLADFDLVKLLAGLLDHGLGSAFVNHEYECVVVFDGLDSALGGSGVSNDSVLVPGVFLVNRVDDSLGLAG